MKIIKRAQVVKFHTPNDDEDPDQLYIVLVVFKDGELTRAKIEALGTNFTFAPISVVLARDLEVDKVKTSELLKCLGDIDSELNLEQAV